MTSFTREVVDVNGRRSYVQWIDADELDFELAAAMDDGSMTQPVVDDDVPTNTDT